VQASRGQSTQVGTVLMVALVVTVSAVGGTYVFDSVDSGSDAPTVDVAGEVTAEPDAFAVRLTNMGGAPLRYGDLSVVAESGERSDRVRTSSVDGDETFAPSESWRPSLSLDVTAGDTVRVYVVHEPSGELLFEDERRVAAATTTTTTAPPTTTADSPSTPAPTTTTTSPDTTPPTVLVSADSAEPEQFTVSVTATEELASLVVDVAELDDVTLTLDDFARQPTEAGYQYVATVTDVDDGYYTVTVTDATDAAGNDGSGDSDTVEVEEREDDEEDDEDWPFWWWDNWGDGWGWDDGEWNWGDGWDWGGGWDWRDGE